MDKIVDVRVSVPAWAKIDCVAFNVNGNFNTTQPISVTPVVPKLQPRYRFGKTYAMRNDPTKGGWLVTNVYENGSFRAVKDNVSILFRYDGTPTPNFQGLANGLIPHPLEEEVEADDAPKPVTMATLEDLNKARQEIVDLKRMVVELDFSVTQIHRAMQRAVVSFPHPGKSDPGHTPSPAAVMADYIRK